MTTMPIGNHPLTQRRMQFIRISVNKLTLSSDLITLIICESISCDILSEIVCCNNFFHIPLNDVLAMLQF